MTSPRVAATRRSPIARFLDAATIAVPLTIISHPLVAFLWPSGGGGPDQKGRGWQVAD